MVSCTRQIGIFAFQSFTIFALKLCLWFCTTHDNCNWEFMYFQQLQSNRWTCTLTDYFSHINYLQISARIIYSHSPMFSWPDMYFYSHTLMFSSRDMYYLPSHSHVLITWHIFLLSYSNVLITWHVLFTLILMFSSSHIPCCGIQFLSVSLHVIV